MCVLRSTSDQHSLYNGVRVDVPVCACVCLPVCQELGVFSWPTWGCGVSKFPWSYAENETCYVLEGRVTVTPDGERSTAENSTHQSHEAGLAEQLSCASAGAHVPVVSAQEG